MKLAALCYLTRGTIHLGGRNLICLARKKKKIGAGLLNGYGGHIEKGESPLNAARRELREEAMVTLVRRNKVACVTFFERAPATPYRDLAHYDAQWEVHIFIGQSEFGKEPKETDEMGIPEWFSFDSIPYKEMLPADRYILPLILAGDFHTFSFEADVYYSPWKKEVEWITIRPFN